MTMFSTSLLGAVLPTCFLVWMIWWADRYEREPVRLLVRAFLWGAVPAIVLALGAELALTLPFDMRSVPGQLVSMALLGPIIEELAKGLGLLGLLRFSRPEIDGALDGIIYGALVGAGFAMTENFLYFVGESPDQLHSLILLRAGVFGLNHIFFTAIFGAGVGIAARTSDRLAQLFYLATGMMGAILVHMLHNTGSVLSQVSPAFLLLSTMMLWSGLLAFFLLILLLLARERRIIRAYLASGQAPPLSPQETARLMRLLPSAERLLPTALLPAPAKRRARIYQLVAELSFRWRRVPRATGEERQRLEQEMAQLEEVLRQLTA
jgi:RsiW-degrading membrane proteinase PrsW (M82 family)